MAQQQRQIIIVVMKCYKNKKNGCVKYTHCIAKRALSTYSAREESIEHRFRALIDGIVVAVVFGRSSLYCSWFYNSCAFERTSLRQSVVLSGELILVTAREKPRIIYIYIYIYMRIYRFFRLAHMYAIHWMYVES